MNMESDKEIRWELHSWPELEQELKTRDTVLLPAGAIEQHGKHLPLDVDFFDAVELARSVARRCNDPKPIVVPGIPFGVSYHHEDFSGTLSVSNESLSRFVYDIGMGLARQGVKKLVIVNGHGDNAPTLMYAAQMINRDSHIFVCVDTGESSDAEVSKFVETVNDVHAGEVETSTSMALRPELVNMDEAVDETIEFKNDYLDFSSTNSVPWYVRTSRISESGVLGNASLATKEKGKQYWEIIVNNLVKLVESIKDKSLDELHQRRY